MTDPARIQFFVTAGLNNCHAKQAERREKGEGWTLRDEVAWMQEPVLEAMDRALKRAV